MDERAFKGENIPKNRKRKVESEARVSGNEYVTGKSKKNKPARRPPTNTVSVNSIIIIIYFFNSFLFLL